MSVYSTRFAGGLHTGGALNVYTVPGTMTVVVRCITAYNAGASIDAFEVSGQLSGSIIVPIFHISSVAPALASDEWEGRVVFNAGEVIAVATGGQQWSYTISGYLLSP